MKFQDRNADFRRIPAKDLKPNPRNWREHPTAQSDALRGVLAEIGWADAVLARETDDGLELIDGHLRAEIALDEMTPVLVLDVTDEEADKILASHDPIGAGTWDLLVGFFEQTDSEEVQSCSWAVWCRSIDPLTLSTVSHAACGTPSPWFTRK